MEVDLFVPCFIDQLFPETAFNTIKVLERAGCSVHYNPEQTCCGQPAYNAGHWKESWPVGRKFVEDFSKQNGGRPVVGPSGSCVGFVRNGYGELFDNTSIHNASKDLCGRIWELSEFLVDVLDVDSLGSRFEGRVTYHDACAALRECGIKSAPRRLLAQVQGLELVEMVDSETCCGFGGTFSVKFEPISTGMADSKTSNAAQTGADVIVSTDLSCLMHLDGYLRKQQSPMRVMHLADVLASGL